MKVLLYDVETSYITAYVHSLYPDRIAPSQIKHDWFMICAAWKWVHGKRVYSASVADHPQDDHRNDRYVVKRLAEAISQADAVVAHNGDNFDIKRLRARMMEHDMPPLPPITQIDTLKEVRRMAKFTSHRLDYLCEKLCAQGKMDTQPGLWAAATEGDKKAVRDMVRYNRQDVVALEDLYLRLVPTISKLNHGLFVVDSGGNPVAVCPHCASPNAKHMPDVPPYKTKTAAYPLYQCDDCGGWSRGKTAIAGALLR